MATTLTPLHSTASGKFKSPVKIKPMDNETTANLPRKYIELRPKPVPVVRNGHPIRVTPVLGKFRSLRNPYSGCLISLCRTRRCRLMTHHAKNFTRTSKDQDAPPDELIAAHGYLRLVEIGDPNLNALPNLPIDILDVGEAKRLFHIFFSYDYPRQQALLLPPSDMSATKQSNESLLRDALNRALSSAVYCLNYIASAHLHELNRSNNLSPNKVSAVLRGKLLQHLRETLDNFRAAESENILPVILTIVQFDMVLTQSTAFDGHRNALQSLINTCGGFHNFHYAAQYILTLDRILAMFTRKPPLYAERVDRKLLRPPQLQPLYGLKLNTIDQRLEMDAELLTFCYDVCRAIEIVEHEEWTFKPDRTRTSFDPSHIQYLYFLKYHIHNTFAHLQSNLLLNPQKSMPILFATNVVAYLILQINYLPAVTLLLAKRLRKSLEEQKLPNDWSDNGDILCWIMCVLLTNPGCWDGRGWAQKCLVQLLSEKYNHADWPTSWINDALQNVRCFVWSCRLDESLEAALSQLDQPTAARNDQMKIGP